MQELLTGIITTDVSFALIACNFDWVIVVDIFVALEQVPSYTRYNKNCSGRLSRGGGGKP